MTTVTTSRIREGVATRAETFELINRYQSENPHHHLGFEPGQWFEIRNEEYWYFLEVLPPLGFTGHSFAMSEFTTEDLTDSFHEISGRYFCGLLKVENAASLGDLRAKIRAEAGL